MESSHSGFSHLQPPLERLWDAVEREIGSEDDEAAAANPFHPLDMEQNVSVCSVLLNMQLVERWFINKFSSFIGILDSYGIMEILK